MSFSKLQGADGISPKDIVSNTPEMNSLDEALTSHEWG
jgi:hypothetical protein